MRNLKIFGLKKLKLIVNLILVRRNLLLYLFIIVLAVVGNKEDLYENLEVEKDEAIDFAKQINAIFKNTSCLKSTGIDELFEEIGKLYLNPNLEITSNLTKEEIMEVRNKKKIKIKMKDEIQSGSKACC